VSMATHSNGSPSGTFMDSRTQAVRVWCAVSAATRTGTIRSVAALARDVKGRARTMGILSWLIVGFIAGFLAKFVVPGEGPGGIIGDIIIGIVGAFIGGWVFNYFGHAGVTGVNVGSIVVAFIGAVILLFILRAVTGRRAAL
jgi:uncharacterized membrane protein YeaQ/YmgE (transglycosylase-associated protein family)